MLSKQRYDEKKKVQEKWRVAAVEASNREEAAEQAVKDATKNKPNRQQIDRLAELMEKKLRETVAVQLGHLEQAQGSTVAGLIAYGP